MPKGGVSAAVERVEIVKNTQESFPDKPSTEDKG